MVTRSAFFLTDTHLIDLQDIVSKVLNILSSEVAASSDKPAAITSDTGKARKKRKSDDDDSEHRTLQRRMADSMTIVAYNTACESLRLEQKALRELRLALVKEQDADTRKIYEDDIADSTKMVFRLKHRIGCLERQLYMNSEDE